MKGDGEIIKALNQVLTGELTAINQYFLHSRILKNQGYEKLSELECKASIDEMKHADAIIQRILFLSGYPQLQALNKLRIGKSIEEIIQNDLLLEYEALKCLKAAITLAENKGDFTSQDLFLDILKSEEHHIQWLESQQHLLKEAGLANYAQSQIMMDRTYDDADI